MLVSWSILKSFAQSRNLAIQWIDLTDSYYLKVFDGQFEIQSEVFKSSPENADQLDFETNFKASGNTNLSQHDSDGANIVRLKAAKKGWSFWAIPIEITTSTLGGSLYCKDSNLVDIPGITAKVYDASDAEVATAGLLNANLATITKTVVDFEPMFDYEIIGGALRINSNPAVDTRLWIVGAPDIPAIYGGSKEFASGINLKFLAPDSSFEIDGRVTKFLTYNPTTHSGKMRMIIRHPAGANINIQITIHIYRQ